MGFLSKIFNTTEYWKRTHIRDMIVVGYKNKAMPKKVSSKMEDICEELEIPEDVVIDVVKTFSKDPYKILTVHPKQEEDKINYVRNLVEVLCLSYGLDEKPKDPYKFELTFGREFEKNINFIRAISNQMELSPGYVNFALYHHTWQMYGSF
jgi:hypothetical protein